MSKNEVKITIAKNGPYLVTGSVPLAKETIGTNAAGESTHWVAGHPIETKEQYALCRCGNSKSKPFCDGTHAKVPWDGAETATRDLYAKQAQTLDGPEVQLKDAEKLCAFGRFCDPHGQVWGQVSHVHGAPAKERFETQVNMCPAGRLVAVDKATGHAVEPKLPVSIGLVEDPKTDSSGPLWVRGGVPVVGADGHVYETRNRVTLCRCGASSNKPFCDGSHASVKFHDGL